MSYATSQPPFAGTGAQTSPYRPWAESAPEKPAGYQYGPPTSSDQQGGWQSWSYTPQPQGESQHVGMDWRYGRSSHPPSPPPCQAASQPIPINGQDAGVSVHENREYSRTANGYGASYNGQQSFRAHPVGTAPVYHRAGQYPQMAPMYQQHAEQSTPSWAPSSSFATYQPASERPVPNPPTGGDGVNVGHGRMDDDKDAHDLHDRQQPVAMRQGYAHQPTPVNQRPLQPSTASHQARQLHFGMSPAPGQAEPVVTPTTPPSSSSAENYAVQASHPQSEAFGYANYSSDRPHFPAPGKHVVEVVHNGPPQYATVNGPMPQPKIGFQPMSTSPSAHLPAAQHSDGIAGMDSKQAFYHNNRRPSIPGKIYSQAGDQTLKPTGAPYYQHPQHPRGGVMYPMPQHGQSPIAISRPGVQTNGQGAGMGQMDMHGPMYSKSYIPSSMPTPWPRDFDASRLSTSAPNHYPGMSAAETALLRRREMHNLLERKRRSGLKDCFQTLAEVLPDVDKEEGSGSTPAKVMILQLATKRIRDLKSVVSKGQGTLAQLRADNSNLRQRLAQLQGRKMVVNNDVEVMES